MLITFTNCQKDPIINPNIYNCTLAFADNSSYQPKQTQFETAMKKIEQLVPGVQVAVRSKDGNIWLGSQGMADIPNQIPFEKCTKTMVGSVSKIYTAVLIMQLQEDSILSINDPISDWIDTNTISEISNADKVSIKQLLMHTSGIKDYLDVKFQLDALNTPNFKLTPQEKLKYIYGKSADFNPDEKFGYSNSNYVLLGLIIENARKKSLENAIETYINNPLGFTNTETGTPDNPIPSGTARPYLALHNGGKYTDIMHFAVSDGATGDGAIATNMQEALYFIESIANGIIISLPTKEIMLNLRVATDTDNWYSLGLDQQETSYGFRYGHRGSTSSYWSFLYHYPDSNITIAIAFNGDTEQNDEYNQLQSFINEIIDLAFE